MHNHTFFQLTATEPWAKTRGAILTSKCLMISLLALAGAGAINAQTAQYDPPCVVEKWSDESTAQKIIDINFSDADMPNTWKGKIGTETPSFADGGYSNGRIEVATWEDGERSSVTYPLIFHNCTFANKNSFGGKAGTTAAFARMAYGDKKMNNHNDWTEAGHTVYIEDNIVLDANGNPTYGEAGFAHLCRDASTTNEAGEEVSMHGWIEIDHIPYIERVQWAWSSSAWGRGVKCDIKIGNEDWKPLVWMGSNKQKQGYTVYSDQGYFMENVIDASDVSLRWRIWDGDGNADNKFQTDAEGNNIFASVATNPMGQNQPVKIHKIRIFGNTISEEQAQYARDNQVSDFGEFTYGKFEDEEEEAASQDTYVGTVVLTVDPEGNGDYTTIQAAVDAVEVGYRGIIFVRNGTYAEHVNIGSTTLKNKYISLIGESREGVVLTSDVSRGNSESVTYDQCTALNVYADKFYAENLTIQNTSGNVGQAEALYIAGDAYMLRNCNILGYQDTFKSNAMGRGYMLNCTIAGAVDYIYDSGLVWFEGCTLRNVGAGYVTAPADASLYLTKALYDKLEQEIVYCGMFFSNCQLTAAEGVAEGSCYLGRPWKEKGGAMYLNCTVGSHIAAAGWKEWNSTDVSFMEYGSKNANGETLDVSNRVSWSSQTSATEVAEYWNTAFLFSAMSGKDLFTPTSLIGTAKAPDAEIVKGKVKWSVKEGDVAYIVLRNGEFAGIKKVDGSATTMALDMESATDEYTIVSVSRRGVTASTTSHKPLLAFPTAGGFGKLASGGRGGEVVYVSTLEDDGEGSLRWAFAQHEGKPITIVFGVSGEIVLKSPLKVNRNDWTLAGQTAPGDGIVITHDKVNFGGSQNFIVRNIRFRIGQKNYAGEIYAESACGAENCENFIFDHCTFGWSVEENFDTQDSHFLTVQYSIVHEGLYNAGHSKGVRGYGCQWGGSPATYHHNLLANNLRRSCRFNGSRGEDYVSYIEYFNNVTFNYEGGGNGCYGGENTADITSYTGVESAHECNFVGNYYVPGPATLKTPYFVMPSYARDGATSWGPSKWYFSDNVMMGKADVTADNWLGVNMEDLSGHYTQDQIKATEMIRPTLCYYQYTGAGLIGEYDYDRYAYATEYYESAEAAYNTVLECAGTWNRDEVEKRLVNDVKTQSCRYGGATYGAQKGIIDTEADAEGFYAYATDYTVPTDTDADGMPDAWETENGGDPTTADNNALTESGYTLLEVYLNSLFGEKAGTVTKVGKDLTMESNTVWIGSDSQIHCTASGAYTITVVDMSGRAMAQYHAEGNTFALPALPKGMNLIVVEAPGISTRVIKAVGK